MEAVAEVIGDAVDRGVVPGAGLTVIRDGERFDVIVGVADREGTPLSGESIGRYYSSAKAITSVVVLQLVEAGSVDLDAPISVLLPEWSAVDPAPTVRNLLTHTAGLTYPGDPTLGADPIDAAYIDAGIDHEGFLSLEEFSSRLAGQPLCFLPGTQWRYSVAHDLLGRVVEVAAGRSLENLASERVFTPLGMTRSSFVAADLSEPFGACWEHRPGEDPSIVPEHASDFMDPARMLSGGGGLLSTLNDYTTFCSALLHGEATILGEPWLAMMLSDQLPSDVVGPGPDAGFGFGGLVTRTGASPWPAGVFSWGGYAGTQFLIDRASDLVVCLHIQVHHDFTIPLWGDVLACVYDQGRD